jgi:hypothetical protein
MLSSRVTMGLWHARQQITRLSSQASGGSKEIPNLFPLRWLDFGRPIIVVGRAALVTALPLQVVSFDLCSHSRNFVLTTSIATCLERPRRLHFYALLCVSSLLDRLYSIFPELDALRYMSALSSQRRAVTASQPSSHFKKYLSVPSAQRFRTTFGIFAK